MLGTINDSDLFSDLIAHEVYQTTSLINPKLWLIGKTFAEQVCETVMVQ